MSETIDTSTVGTQGHFGIVDSRIVAIATQGYFEEAPPVGIPGELAIEIVLSNL